MRWNHSVNYFGLLLTQQDKSRKQIAQETHTHPRSLDRRLQQIVRDGIPLTLTEHEQSLPPLTISLRVLPRLSTT